jgi:hypothetical protein
MDGETTVNSGVGGDEGAFQRWKFILLEDAAKMGVNLKFRTLFYPTDEYLKQNNIPYITVDQHIGDTIFFPPGMLHCTTVHNVSFLICQPNREHS